MTVQMGAGRTTCARLLAVSGLATAAAWLTMAMPAGAVPLPPLTTLPGSFESRPIDGSGNNASNPAYGSSGSTLLRLAPAAYADGVSALAGGSRPDPRSISNALGNQTASMPAPHGLSGYFWAFGQLLDHDLSLTHTNPAEDASIPIPAGDPMAGSAVQIPVSRSLAQPGTGTSPTNPRQQPNSVTAFVDASFVYGADPATAATLRANDGSGRLTTAPDGLLPTNGQLGADGDPGNDALRLAGDVRANENAALTSLHTVFLREHNRLADAIQAAHPGITGDETYAAAREIVAGEMQAITYNEFLPILLGKANGIGGYASYDEAVDPGIATEFSAALYRFGHSMVQDEFLLVHPDNSRTAVPLSACFFNPACVPSGAAVESVLAGLGMQPAQALDAKIVDSLRNMLLTDFGMIGIDLLSINLQRGRDHGLPGYLELRDALGLDPVLLSDDLLAVYGSDDIDLLIGALMEDAFGDAIVGETMHWVLSDQFLRLRAGDRFWYQNPDLDGLGSPVFDPDTVAWLDQQTLGDLIWRNTGLETTFGKPEGSVFRVGSFAHLAQSVPAPAPLAVLGVAAALFARRRIWERRLRSCGT